MSRTLHTGYAPGHTGWQVPWAFNDRVVWHTLLYFCFGTILSSTLCNALETKPIQPA